MDTIFLVNEEARSNLLQLLMQSFGCTYICLWSPLAPNLLWSMDGYYQEDNRPTSSSGSLARRLFDAYRQLPFTLDNYDRVPGLAFRTNIPYMELRELELQMQASLETQRQFYQEARIKKAVFMGCRSGEIELGFANETQPNMEMEMRTWFHGDFSQYLQVPTGEQPQPTDHQNPPSSSSSSLRSLSLDSPDSSLLFNIPSTTHITQTLQDVPPLQPILTTTSPHQQAMQEFAQIRNIQLPTPEIEHAAMTRAILAVLTSPSPSSSTSSSHQAQQNLPYNYWLNPRGSAFKNYTSGLARTTSQMRASLQRHSMLKRSISYYSSLNIVRRQHMLSSRPTSTQLHHMISERKRREKLNESFQGLRSLLPPGTKKDKASVLTSTREYLSSLKAQVVELSDRNQHLEAQLMPAKEASEEASGSSNERLDVRVTHVSESTSSEERIIDLQVTVRGDCPIMDMLIRILEFLKQDKNVNLMSMEANTRMAEPSSINRVILRLKVEGSEWDESAFQEAVRRVVADMAQ